MSEMSCRSCGATTSNGLVLCELCQRKAETCFDFLPVYFRNLARWRPGRAGSRPVPGSRVLYDGEVRSPDSTGDRISDTLDEVRTALTTWSRTFIDDRGVLFDRPLTFADAAMAGDLPEEFDDEQALTTTWLCVGLRHHLVSISTLEWAGEMVRELGRHEERLRALTETSMPGWYAGKCQRKIGMDSKCEADTFVVEGLTWVKCQTCGTTTYARDHLDTILDEARGWVARPKRLAEAIVALVDTEPSVPKLYDRIRQWAKREEIQAVHQSKRDYRWDYALEQLVVADVDAGHARYRMGEVLDKVFVAQRAASGRMSA